MRSSIPSKYTHDFNIPKKTKNSLKTNQGVSMPAAGLEPARGCPQQILSLPRLPFRHAGLWSVTENYINISG